jgi:sirohydrochlorin ferrochelatase
MEVSSHHEPARALIVIAHGSPRPEANADLYRLIELCRDKGFYSIVQEAFLECNEPSIPEAIDNCAKAGISEIVAVPYFLHTGKHVADDLPNLLEDGRRRHPTITFRMGTFIGRSPKITDILQKRLCGVVKGIVTEID